MRAVGQESKYYDRVAEGAGATLPIPRHPLRSREWSAGGEISPSLDEGHTNAQIGRSLNM